MGFPIVLRPQRVSRVSWESSILVKALSFSTILLCLFLAVRVPLGAQATRRAQTGRAR